ncbi:MAG TPA: cofactor assembly of complex C subunit B [Chroococcidiopsis sp.]
MAIPVIPSTAFLTALLAVGLFFFIRASTKDRIEIAQWVTDLPETTLLEQLQTYFTQRAYRLTAVDAEQHQVRFEGFVRPSVFLAIFLTTLAAIGALCLSLVLAMLFPDWATVLPVLVLVAPLAGVFYWQKAGRIEQVLLSVEPVCDQTQVLQQLLTVTAHRDELAEMGRSLQFKPVESD